METYRTKNGELRYREKVRYPNGQLESKSFRRKSDATHWKRKTEVEKSHSNAGKALNRFITFAEIAEKWFEMKVTGHKAFRTVQNYRSSLNSNLNITFGRMRIDQIRTSNIEEWINSMRAKGSSPATINREKSILQMVFRFAVEHEYLADNPIKKSFHQKIVRTKFDFYTPAEVAALLDQNKDEPYYPVLYIAAHTGMRPSEIFGLKWDRVNFMTGQIEITRSRVRNVLQEKPKNGKARFFPMTNLRPMFESLRRHSGESDFVFVNAKGNPWSSDHFKERTFKKACERAQVRQLRFYDLRHTFASHYVMNGGNLYALKELMGHSEISMTEIYTHLSLQHLERASQIVSFGEFASKNQVSGPRLAHAVSVDREKEVMSNT